MVLVGYEGDGNITKTGLCLPLINGFFAKSSQSIGSNDQIDRPAMLPLCTPPFIGYDLMP